MKKLRDDDPSNFRQVMNDLQYNGAAPKWHESDLMSKLGPSQSVDLNKMKLQREKLMDEKA